MFKIVHAHLHGEQFAPLGPRLGHGPPTSLVVNRHGFGFGYLLADKLLLQLQLLLLLLPLGQSPVVHSYTSSAR